MKMFDLPDKVKIIYKNVKLLQQVHELCADSKWIECVELCNELISSFDNDFFGYYYRGICNTHFKFFEEAIQDFECATVNAKKNRFPKTMKELEDDAKLRIAHVFRLQRNYTEALLRIDELINHSPEYSPAYISRAGIHTDTNNLLEALDTVNQGLSRFANNNDLRHLKRQLVYDITQLRKEND